MLLKTCQFIKRYLNLTKVWPIEILLSSFTPHELYGECLAWRRQEFVCLHWRRSPDALRLFLIRALTATLSAIPTVYIWKMTMAVLTRLFRLFPLISHDSSINLNVMSIFSNHLNLILISQMYRFYRSKDTIFLRVIGSNKLFKSLVRKGLTLSIPYHFRINALVLVLQRELNRFPDKKILLFIDSHTRSLEINMFILFTDNRTYHFNQWFLLWKCSIQNHLH